MLTDLARQLDVPQQGQIAHCAVSTIWFAKQLILGKTEVDSWNFTAHDSELERLVIANRLSAAIQADTQEHNVQPQDDPHLTLDDNAEVHQRISEALYPVLASTDIERVPPVNEWCAERRKRLDR